MGFVILFIVIIIIFIIIFLAPQKRFKSIEKMITNVTNKRIEKQILKVASEHKGIVTSLLVAQQTDLTIEEAENYLKDLAVKGFVEMSVTDEGRIKYIFKDLIEE